MGVGFGVRTPASAAALAEFSDAVIIGSALVEIIERYAASVSELCRELEAFVTSLRVAMDAQRAA